MRQRSARPPAQAPSQCRARPFEDRPRLRAHLPAHYLPRPARGRRTRARRSCTHSHQINEAEDGDPDDVECVPEQTEAQKSVADALAKTLRPELRHHGAEPQEPGRDMQAVAAHEGKERRQKRTSGGPCAACDETCEFVDLEQNKDESQKAGEEEGDLRPFLAALLYRKARHAADEA